MLNATMIKLGDPRRYTEADAQIVLAKGDTNNDNRLDHRELFRIIRSKVDYPVGKKPVEVYVYKYKYYSWLELDYSSSLI